MSSDSAGIEIAAIVRERPAEVSLGAAPQIILLMMEAGFAYTEARDLSPEERDTFVQLVREHQREARSGRH